MLKVIRLQGGLGATVITPSAKKESAELSTPTNTKDKNEEVDNNLQAFKKLTDRLTAIGAYQGLGAWDSATYMPEAASDTRAWQSSIIEELAYEILISEDIRKLLEYLESELINNGLSNTDKMLVKAIRKVYTEAKKLPSELVKELAEMEAKGGVLWKAAEENNDFESIVPILEKIVELKRKTAEYIGYKRSPYNVLLDDYEEGMTTEELDKVFTELKKELIPLIKALNKRTDKPNSNFLNKAYSIEKQRKINDELKKIFGFEGRIDETKHPFCQSIGHKDVRIATHIKRKDLWFNIGSVIHEIGHALYGEGIAEDIANTRLGDSPSMGIDESQSRLYETIIGQGLPFLIHFYPKLQEDYFPKQLGDVEISDFYKAINEIKRTPIRLDADEVTYQMHIIMRYEIERDLIEGKIEVKDLPTVWAQKSEEYLGVIPNSDREGVLQDCHFYCGLIGYFPTYAIGNIYAAQIYNTAKNEIEDLELKIAKGELHHLREWLREKIHRHGDMKTTKEIIREVTGEDLNPKYLIEYLKSKYSDLYPGLLLERNS